MGGFKFQSLRTRRERKEDRSRSFLSFLRNIRTWHLILLLIPLLFIAATCLRVDHLKMMELRSNVLSADDAGDEEALNAALLELRSFTSHHIVVNFHEKNGTQELVFGTGPFYLDQQYLRRASVALAEAEKRAAEVSDSNPNGNIFAIAASICQPQARANGWAWNSAEYVGCYTDILNSYPASDEITTTITADLPSTALFRYDYASPIWYPSASGWMIVACLVLIAIIVIRILYWIILQIALRIVMKVSK